MPRPKAFYNAHSGHGKILLDGLYTKVRGGHTGDAWAKQLTSRLNQMPGKAARKLELSGFPRGPPSIRFRTSMLGSRRVVTGWEGLETFA